ncbi:MAG: hypothetical protein JJT94_01355 [Bernardetiaceae bacterium]|nr:hypothetical protein [Bernardetiaceae bacterium]
MGRIYELSNHLGNVLVTLTDNIEQTARLVSATDYYPFGMAIHSRSWQSEGYRFGFNGMENDKDLNNGAIDFGARIYDSRIGRFLSVDAKTHKYPHITPYAGLNNNPMFYVDPDGNDNVVYLVINRDNQDKPEIGIETAQKIAAQATEYYRALGLATTVVAFDENERGCFNRQYIDNNDAIVIIGTDRKSMVSYGASIIDEKIKDVATIETWAGRLNGSIDSPEISNGPGAGTVYENTEANKAIGVFIDYNAATMGVLDNITGSAFALVHGTGHNAMGTIAQFDGKHGVNPKIAGTHVLNEYGGFMQEGVHLVHQFGYHGRNPIDLFNPEIDGNNSIINDYLINQLFGQNAKNRYSDNYEINKQVKEKWKKEQESNPLLRGTPWE